MGKYIRCGYFAWLNQPLSARAIADQELTLQIKQH